jgi:hypothetical protein
MGAGLAKQLASKFPIVKQKYKEAYKKGEVTLGSTQLIHISTSLYVANLAAQYNYGTDKIQTDYNALKECLSKLPKNLPIYIPYKLGCGLAGGDWKKVSKILEAELKEYEWYICQL